jgi:RHS repeat-associated protein
MTTKTNNTTAGYARTATSRSAPRRSGRVFLHTASEISDPNGNVVEWVTYDAYGAPAILDEAGSSVSQSAVGSPFLFTGREFDPETGLYYYRARVYSASLGRFLQRDPAGFMSGLNAYEYCESSPATLVDPSGLYPQGDQRNTPLQWLKDATAKLAAAQAKATAAHVAERSAWTTYKTAADEYDRLKGELDRLKADESQDKMRAQAGDLISRPGECSEREMKIHDLEAKVAAALAARNVAQAAWDAAVQAAAVADAELAAAQADFDAASKFRDDIKKGVKGNGIEWVLMFYDRNVYHTTPAEAAALPLWLKAAKLLSAESGLTMFDVSYDSRVEGSFERVLGLFDALFKDNDLVGVVAWMHGDGNGYLEAVDGSDGRTQKSVSPMVLLDHLGSQVDWVAPWVSNARSRASMYASSGRTYVDYNGLQMSPKVEDCYGGLRDFLKRTRR